MVDNCLDCEHCIKVSDPDPLDWFRDDEMAVACALVKNDNTEWIPRMDYRFPNKCVTYACSMDDLRESCQQPDWCPLKENK